MLLRQELFRSSNPKLWAASLTLSLWSLTVVDIDLACARAAFWAAKLVLVKGRWGLFSEEFCGGIHGTWRGPPFWRLGRAEYMEIMQIYFTMIELLNRRSRNG
jgi:hypothetical protein